MIKKRIFSAKKRQRQPELLHIIKEFLIKNPAGLILKYTESVYNLRRVF